MQITNDWQKVVEEETKKPYYKELYKFVKEEYENHVIYPPSDEIFSAFHMTPLKEVKVVILGQDPYHGPNQAHGLAFSVKKSQAKIPPSLQNIYKEIQNEEGYPLPKHGNLESLANQGVLLLNTILTVRANEPLSHKGKGWEIFTDAIIKAIDRQDRAIVFMLWGSQAISKKSILTNPRHLIQEAPHPSPLSAHRGFFGCNHFIKCNEFLIDNGLTPINWKI